MAKTLNPVDVMVKLSTILSPYLTRKVVGFQDPVIILNHLSEHIPRTLYEDVVKCQEVETFFAILEERQTRDGFLQLSFMDFVILLFLPSTLVAKGCISTVFIHATFDHICLDSRYNQ